MKIKTLLKIWIGFVLILIVSTGLLSFWWEGQEQEIDDGAMSKNSSRIDFTNTIGMDFVEIPAGEFMMGSGYNWAWPVHKVVINQPYYLGKYEVTQEQWIKVMGYNPSYFDGSTNPVEQVSWNDTQEFVKRLNEMEGTDKYRLPSEAEWEYACRAGSTTSYSFGNKVSDLDKYA
jgi:formylglycine-generating enzyme required for sulfatase activity